MPGGRSGFPINYATRETGPAPREHGLEVVEEARQWMDPRGVQVLRESTLGASVPECHCGATLDRAFRKHLPDDDHRHRDLAAQRVGVVVLQVTDPLLQRLQVWRWCRVRHEALRSAGLAGALRSSRWSFAYSTRVTRPSLRASRAA